MRGDFSVVVLLPLSRLEVELGPLTLRQAMQVRYAAKSTPRPEYLAEGEWVGLHDLAARVRRFGAAAGVTADELLDLPDADTSVMMDGVQEVVQREGRFRAGRGATAGGDVPGGQGDGLDAGVSDGDGRG